MAEKSVRFTVERNNFRKGIFYGNVLSRATADIGEIVKTLVTWTHPDDLQEVLTNVGREVVRQLREGNRVSFGEYVTLDPLIKGAFRSKDDVFDPARHSLGVRIQAGRRLRILDGDGRIRIRRVKSIRRV